jgi:signal transduction histidine kinase/CheY-like chemotaxis protein
MRRPDLPVGAWLGIGFGAAGLLLVALVALAAALLGRIEEAEHRQAEVIVPRAVGAAQLERAVLGLAIRARTFGITAQREDLDRYRGARERVLAAYRTLDGLPKDLDGGTIFEDIGPLLTAYLEVADRFVAVGARRDGRELAQVEDVLAAQRDVLLDNVVAYADLQRAKRAEEGAAILRLRTETQRVLVLAVVAVLLLFAATARVVARYVKGPVDELARAARHVGAGDYGSVADLASSPGAPAARSELTQLKRTFGSMAAAIQEREARIAAQNEEVQAQNEELQSQQEELQSQQEELQSQQEELQSQNEELQSQQEELHAQADQLREQEKELRQALESLAEADRRKSEFLAMLSHELRNPLAPIVTGLHLLGRADAGSPQARRARETIARQVTHLVRLVDDLLDITRISRGKIHLERRPVDLVGLVRHAAEDHAATVAARGVVLDVSLPAPGPLVVNADAARLTQAVGNLVSNAAKFTPGGGRVTVVVTAGGTDGARRATIRVRDTGIGIAPDVLPRLFQPFMQVETSLARTRGGLGLGLALVKALVELHGGTVGAASDGEGKGAEFTIELPLDGVPSPGGGRGAGAASEARRVLVVEDDGDSAAALADLLRLEGHEVEVAQDGDAALRKAREWRPHLVLCDVGLPLVDGYEVARRFRADPELSGTFLVAITGYAPPDGGRRARDAGFDEHLTKPARPEDLAGVLSRAPVAPVR